MKKYWHGGSPAMVLVIGVLVVAVFLIVYLLMDALSLGSIAALVIGGGGGLMLALKQASAPGEPFTRFWIEAEMVCEEQLLPHRVRKMPLAAPYTYRYEAQQTNWLVLAEEEVATMKAASELNQQGKAMFVPVAGSLAAELAERVKAAKRIE